jgi:hypothetical protein
MKLDPFPGTLTKQAVASGRQLAGKVMKWVLVRPLAQIEN